jgi:GT2 family glycosyltransferase
VKPRVAIILVNLNQEDLTRTCIESLLRVTYENLEIVLIDNNSSDGSGRRIHDRYPAITYHHLEMNLGFAGGNNTGMKIALDHKADFIMLLNNDTEVSPDCIQPLVVLAAKEPAIAAQCGKIYMFSDKRKLWYAGGTMDIPRAHASHRGIWQEDRGQFDDVEDTGFASGCMLFVSRGVIENVGMLDEGFFIYHEDVDWCLRMKRRGYRVVYNPQARIWHKVSSTNRIDSPFYLYFTMRNKILLVRKHASASQWIWHLPYFLYYYSRHLIRMSMKWRSWHGTRAILYGMIDGLRNFTGEFGRGRIDRLVRP